MTATPYDPASEGSKAAFAGAMSDGDYRRFLPEQNLQDPEQKA